MVLDFNALSVYSKHSTPHQELVNYSVVKVFVIGACIYEANSTLKFEAEKAHFDRANKKLGLELILPLPYCINTTYIILTFSSN